MTSLCRTWVVVNTSRVSDVPFASAVPIPTAGIDPRVALATAIHAAPGVYAVLIGSGVSTGAGIPTGWQVVQDLIRRIARAEGADLKGFDATPEAWWESLGRGEPRYDTLISALAGTDAARQALLRAYFDPPGRADSPSLPTPAHHALASLCASGRVRVLMTTNFDRLMERALDQVGLTPQVIASPTAVRGMTPLIQAPLTVLKLHGDYAMPGLRNTPEELRTYPRAWPKLLARIFDEFGLLVVGWSAEYDVALAEALAGSASRRYPTFWTRYRRDLSEPARRLVGQRAATVIATQGADEFLSDLVERIERLDHIAVRRARSAPLRPVSYMPPSSAPPQGWSGLPLLLLRVAAAIGPASSDDCGPIRANVRMALSRVLSGAALTLRVQALGERQAVPALADRGEMTPAPIAQWEPTPGAYQTTAQASYRLGGDATAGVSSLMEVRLPAAPYGGVVLFTVDLAISIAGRLTLLDVTLLLRDMLVLATADLPEATADVPPPDAEVHRAEIHIAAPFNDGTNRTRSNDLAERVDFSPLGEPSRAVGNSMGIAYRIPGPLSERDAAELLIQAIEYMALDGGFLDPGMGLTTLRRDLDL